ncbi:unnamed protein product [Mycena citricolor]|uniref:UBC core domain-containing protein n=1 Tax=Mycena citricolor TaxID=2018698 RepID=A0AAD2HUP5_9AGAR|nr:unnamed protein product [Mycena citricolor]
MFISTTDSFTYFCISPKYREFTGKPCCPCQSRGRDAVMTRCGNRSPEAIIHAPPSAALMGRNIETKFYQQDVVRRVTSPTSQSPDGQGVTGIVMRCWHDVEEIPPATAQSDPLMRPLSQGEVGVSFFRDADSSHRHEFDRQILPEAELVLVDRTFHPGDFCKRTVDGLVSGVITESTVEGRCEHVVTGERVGGWTKLEELADRTYAEVGDLVVVDDWIGQVIELYDEVLVETSNKEIVRLPELGSRLSIGERGPDILPAPASSVYNLFGFLLGNTRPSSQDMCVQVTHTVYAITWLAISQALDPAVTATRQRPQQFWTAEDMSRLTLIRSVSDLAMRVGDRVEFKDPDKGPKTMHGPENGTQIPIQTFAVTETRTHVQVLWQDGTRETLRSTELIPYLNPDEYDCWPGDWALWNREDENQAVIIQAVNPDRTVSVLVPETGKTELISALELDPHGVSDAAAMHDSPSDGLGVRRGDFLFIHAEGGTNGSRAAARVPRIGEVEAWVRDVPVVNEQLVGFRKEMSEIGESIARRRQLENIAEQPILRPLGSDESLFWLGEVSDINLDGTVQIVHPNGTARAYPLHRLTKLYDGIDQLEDDMWDQASNGDDVQFWSLADGDWEENSSDGSWPKFDDTAEFDSPELHDEVQDASINDEPPDVPSAPPEEPTLDLDGPAVPSEPEEDPAWRRFEILASAPVDHAYYSAPPARPSKQFLTRLSREYRTLSFMSDSILVRAYEDRTDLLRSLIIGPENTPYEDAPFVIDWMLDSNFPQSPPLLHFLSWTNGNGRVHPNLYEEGKVCLSILGTWAGDKDEIWNATRSTLLQVLVSIQGLVLVKEPWFCEPAYEKLRGTQEGIVNRWVADFDLMSAATADWAVSRLYSEKAYVLSRGFVRRALELAPGGLESEIDWLYRRSGRLDKVISDAQRLIEKSKQDGESGGDDLAVPRLSAGGIITLSRTVSKLMSLPPSPT